MAGRKRMPPRVFREARARANQTVEFILGERDEPHPVHVEVILRGEWRGR